MGELLVFLFGFFSGGVALYFFLRNNPNIEIRVDKAVDFLVDLVKRIINKFKKK